MFKLRLREKNNKKRYKSSKYIRISVFHCDREGEAFGFMGKHSEEIHSDRLGVKHTVWEKLGSVKNMKPAQFE